MIERLNLNLGIKTKFIILMAALMAVVLALQLYFTTKTQQDVLKELGQISTTINQATDNIILKELKEPFFDTDAQVLKDTLIREQSVDYIFQNDQAGSIEHYFQNIKVKSGDSSADSAIVTSTIRDNLIIHLNKSATQKWRPKSTKKIAVRRLPLKVEKKITGQFNDSMNVFLEEIELNINHDDNNIETSGTIIQSSTVTPGQIDKSPVFSFTIPDFTVPDEPRLLRYRYNTAAFEKALSEIRNRNLLITLIIFVISLLLIMLITRRFLRPIDSLKTSFDKVVNGDLAVAVENSSSDEIGELTRAFNQMVQELKKNREKEQLLQRKERLASLGQLAAGVAHEIKNPLNAINLTIDHLDDTVIPKDNPKANGYIVTVQNEIRRLDKIVNNFLNYVRSEELDKKPLELNSLIMEVVQLYEREMSTAGINCELKLDKKFNISADAERLKTALVNIVLNGIQAMPDGGQLLIVSEPDQRQIRIVDNGQGISEKDQEHIFDLFYTTKSTGTGLGLPTAYKIIREHDADIDVRSTPGQGTEIVVRFSEKNIK